MPGVLPGVFGSTDPLFLLLLALGVEALYGGTAWAEQWLPRPLKLAVKVILFLDRHLNQTQHSSPVLLFNGGLAAVALVVLFAAVGWGLSLLTHNAPLAWLIEVLLLALFFDHRALQVRLTRVRKGMAAGSLITARGEVYPLVAGLFRSNDLHNLGEDGVAVAAVGGAARSFVERFIAPAFWYALLGLPGLFAQQAVFQAAHFYRQRHLQARMVDGYSKAIFAVDKIFQVLPDAIAAILFILAALFVPGTALGTAIRRCWSGQHLADAALGGALRLRAGEGSDLRKALERASLMLVIAGIMAIGAIAAAMIVISL